MTFSYEDCPYCGEPGVLEVIPLWYRDFGRVGHNKYRIFCPNRHCEVQPHTRTTDDIGRTREVAVACVEFLWNRMIAAVTDSDNMFASGMPL